MMVMDNGTAEPFIKYPFDEGISGEEWHDRMPGLLALTRMLRYPEFVFGEASEREAREPDEVIDWDQVPHEIRRYLEYWDTGCGAAMLLIEVAANIVRRHGARICRGDPSIEFMWEDDTMTVIVDLSIDAPCETISEMNRELCSMALFLDIPHRGFSFYFTVGEGAEAEVEASLERELERHRALGLDIGD
ncbi:MAG: hypothetical protein J7598_06865 [Mitsuaria chitosanitabida]|uniref:hypothetical protein n=1 Tax=Roseateles chitosanitabidus TaxID=65048 RepID=UPI001B1B9A97|nr:hypothetical protein [Roseateles chitosanitabidus]MBO9686315.1 hypothetical protein [Roseateles chitosanitabidus]